jgi:hypothetical protein
MLHFKNDILLLKGASFWPEAEKKISMPEARSLGYIKEKRCCLLYIRVRFILINTSYCTNCRMHRRKYIKLSQMHSRFKAENASL